MDDEIKTSAEAEEAAVLHTARAAHADPDAKTLENSPLPVAVTRKPAAQKSPAEWAYERLILYVQKFEEQLDGDQEVAMGFAGSNAGTLHIRGMGYFAPDLITFYGLSDNGQKLQLVQHISQLNVMFRAEKKLKDKANRIGFELAKSLED